MKNPRKPVCQPAPVVQLCVCCVERPHDKIPDRDLEGYVCRLCARQLRAVVKAFTSGRMTGGGTKSK